MASSSEGGQRTPTPRRHRRWILIWLGIDLTVVVVVGVLLFHHPAAYKPVPLGEDGNDPDRVDPYLTRLSSDLYNGAQAQAPFDLVILEEGVNRALAAQRWSDPTGGAVFSSPRAVFSPRGLTLMGQAELKGTSLVVTVGVRPRIDDQGLLRLDVTKVKVGALSLTPLARMVAKRMYAQRLAEGPVPADDLRSQIAAALLNDQPFEPVMRVRNRRVRLKSLELQRGQVVLRFVPLPQERKKIGATGFSPVAPPSLLRGA